MGFSQALINGRTWLRAVVRGLVAAIVATGLAATGQAGSPAAASARQAAWNGGSVTAILTCVQSHLTRR